MLINEVLQDIRFRSFFMDGEMVCECLALFFKVSTVGWVSLTVSEGTSKFEVSKFEPELIDLSKISDNFAYPISSLKGLDKYLGLKISAIYEYRIKNIKEGCIGVFIEFGDCGVSFIEVEGCLRILEGVMQYSNTDVFLHKIEV